MYLIIVVICIISVFARHWLLGLLLSNVDMGFLICTVVLVHIVHTKTLMSLHKC